MNIGMILEAPFPPDTRVENECRTLVEVGHTIHIFAVSFDDKAVSEEYADNIFVHRLKLSRWMYNKLRVTLLRLPFYNLLWLKFLHAQASNLRLDVIHIHDIPLAKVGEKFAKERSIPFILDLHENYPAALQIWDFTKKIFGSYFLNIESWRRYEIEYAHKANKVVVVVEEAMERFNKAGVENKKLVVISNTLNLHQFGPNETQDQHILKKSSFQLVYAGGFGPHRGLQVAIKAMPEIIRQVPDAGLVLVGDGSDREELKALVAEQNLQEHIRFLGWIRLEHLPRIIHESDIGIVPYLSSEHTETTVPHKLFQYMYLQKPVVVSNCGPLQRIVTETNSGLVYKAGDSRDFADKALMLQDERLRRKLGENGHQAVRKRYNWSVDGRRLVELYRGLR